MLRGAGSGVFVPAHCVPGDLQDFVGWDERPLADARAALGNRSLPSGAIEVLCPEGPRAAVLGARRIDVAAVPLVEEWAGRLVYTQRDTAIFFLAITLQEGGPVELQVFAKGFDISLGEIHESVLVVGLAAVAALGALKSQTLFKPRFMHFLG